MPRVRAVLVRQRGLAALAIVLALLAFWLSRSAQGASTVSTRRLGGNDRYETARVIAEGSFASAAFALLARGDDYPDALAGSYLAGNAGTGPVVLTEPTRLNANALTTLQTLRVSEVYILGGTSAIGSAVEQDLRDRGYRVLRVEGATRYDTAAAVARSLGAAGVGRIGAEPTAILATGEEFADALSGGPLAFRMRFPVLLTTATTLSPQADQALTDLGIERVLILGGTDAVAPTVEAQVAARGIATERLAGANRRGTAVEVARFAQEQGFSNTHVNLARGDDFPDSLAGGPHAGRDAGGSPILLSESPDALGTETRDYLAQNNATIESIDAFGGTGAVSDEVLAEARDASTCNPGTTTTTLPAVTTTTGAACVVRTTTTTGGTGTTTTTSTTTTSTTTTTLPI
jgi:putative cell wall-binding protein